MSKNNGISIIIVTYNNERTIKDCLDSIVKYSPDSEVRVVDNGSKDATLNIVNKFAKDVKLIEAGKNLGFAKGNNLGAKEAKGEYLVFLNPDAFLTSAQSLEILQNLLEKNLKYAVLGPRLIYPDGRQQKRARNLPTVMGAFKEYILGIKGVYSFYEPECETLCEVESVIGACMIIRGDIFQKVGGFDERYFMYYEDLELCKSVRNLGYLIGFVPDICVKHAEGISGQNQKTNEFMRDSAKKYFGFMTYYVLELFFFYNRTLNKIRKTTGYPAHV